MQNKKRHIFLYYIAFLCAVVMMLAKTADSILKIVNGSGLTIFKNWNG